MNAFRSFASVLLVAVVALPAAATEEDDEPGSSASRKAVEPESYIEIVVRGKSHRVPISRAEGGRIQLEDPGLEVTIRPIAEGDVPDDPGVSSPGSKGGPKAEPGGPWSPSLLIASVLCVALAGMATYSLVIEPRRRRRPLIEAIRLIESLDSGRFREAEELLDRALLAGLRRKDIAEARFAMAYVRARLGNYAEAATVLQDMEKAGQLDVDTLYLALWVQLRLERYEKVERLFEDHGRDLIDRLDTKLIAGIAFLELARIHWARRDVDTAVRYYAKLRELDVLTEEIPPHIDDQAIVLGIVSLFDGDHAGALEHFTGAAEAAVGAGKSPVNGELGVLLCEWRAEPRPDLDARLGKLLSTLQASSPRKGKRVGIKCPHCGKAYRVRPEYQGQRVACRECRRRFVADLSDADSASTVGDDGDREVLLNDHDLLVRNVALWHVISLLQCWRSRPERSGLPGDQFKILAERSGNVAQLDPELGDPHLIVGLIGYYIASRQADRDRARAYLEKAVALEVHVPEVLLLLERERKLDLIAKNSLNFFHRLTIEYASNPEVDAERRRKLKEKLERFQRFRSLGEIDIRKSDQAAAPSVADLQNRGVILRNRVANIVNQKLKEAPADARDQIFGLLEKLEAETLGLAANARSVEEAEYDLMESTGEFLFAEEEPIAKGADNGQTT